MILIIDNYDSFTYNLVQYVGEYNSNIKIIKNDEYQIHEIKKWPLSKIIISPGPKSPRETGISKSVINEFKGKIPILGICLGHQCIGEVFGGETIHAPYVMHGKNSSIKHKKTFLFHNVKSPFLAGRYHSLVLNPDNFPHDQLIITAQTKDRIIMGIQHKKYPIYGLQFHPESILTEEGKKIIYNFIK